jgi:hypothetical protein
LRRQDLPVWRGSLRAVDNEHFDGRFRTSCKLEPNIPKPIEDGCLLLYAAAGSLKRDFKIVRTGQPGLIDHRLAQYPERQELAKLPIDAPRALSEVLPITMLPSPSIGVPSDDGWGACPCALSTVSRYEGTSLLSV